MDHVSFSTFNGIEAGIYVHDGMELVSDFLRREHKWFEQDLLMRIAQRHPQHGTVVDVGANIGNHSCFFAHYLTFERLFAIEPVVENVAVLAANLAPWPSCTVVAAACLDGDGECAMQSTGDRNSGMYRVCDGAGTRAARLDLLLQEMGQASPVTLLKIDVEGSELAVLRGARGVLLHDRPVVYVEATSLRSLHSTMQLMQQFYYDLTAFVDPENPTFEFSPRCARSR